jgi:isoleucyl-tRNA synthetase
VLETKSGPIELLDGEWEEALAPNAQGHPGTLVCALSDRKSIVALDATVTPELEQEGLVRDLVRLIQSARKQAGFKISDRIEAWIEGSSEVARALQVHGDFVREQVLATNFFCEPVPKHLSVEKGAVGEREVSVAVKRLES